MNIRQAFKMAIKSISAKKMRSFLTMLGIIIGVASVVIMVSVVQGSNKATQEYYESMGTNKITVYANSWNSSGMADALYDYCLQLDDLVLGVTPNEYAGYTVKYGAKSSDTMDYSPDVYLGSNQWSACNNFQISRGRDLSFLDIQNYNQVCVLGSKAAEAFFNYANPIGETMTINSVPFTVVGVYAQKDFTENNWSLDNVMVMPYTAKRALGGGSQLQGQFIVKAKDSASTTEAITRLSGFLAGYFGDGDQDSGNYYVYSENTWMEQEQSQNLMMSLVLGGIAGISLLVGGIGIMNIMLVTVTERTREIGIRKAIGAERKSIITQFLIESAMICGIGGIIGIIIGFLGTLIAGKLILQTILLPSTTITIGAFFFSVVLGILFGMYPAVKASGLQPVVALRAE